MNIKAHIRITYKNKTVDKQISISGVLDKTHAERLLKTHIRNKYPKSKSYRALELK